MSGNDEKIAANSNAVSLIIKRREKCKLYVKCKLKTELQ